MIILYLGSNIRMRLSAHSAPGLRALGIKQGMEQAGFQFMPVMAGDQVRSQLARKLYSNQLKRFLPPQISGALRDMYEILLDQRFYRVADARFRDIQPTIILQKHSRYGRVGVRLGQRYNIPVFLDDITPVWEGERYSDRSLKRIARHIRKDVFSNASGLIAVSPEMVTQLQSEGVPSNKIHFVPNGVDCNLFNPDATSMEVRQKCALNGKVVVGYVGGFQHWHRLDLFITAAFALVDLFPNIHFLMVGDDKDGQVTKMVRDRGLSNSFTFPGGMPHSEVPLYINAMDITVLPSTLPYMSPMKIYEYMAMGKPVIAPNKNAIVETVVTPNHNGLLFEAENVDSMKNAIVTLVTAPELRQKMGIESRKSAINNYSWYHQANNLIQAFIACLPISSNQASEFASYGS